MEHWSKKKSLKFEQQNELIQKKALKYFFARGAYFYKNFQIMTKKAHPTMKIFSAPTLTKIFKGMSPSYWPNPNGKP